MGQQMTFLRARAKLGHRHGTCDVGGIHQGGQDAEMDDSSRLWKCVTGWAVLG